MELTVAELFAGVGGFRVGLNKIEEIDDNGRAVENNVWNFVWANQYEPSTKLQHAFECYTHRFGNDNNSNVDINKVIKTDIPNHSLLVGGFPCQDYSVARSLSNEKGIEGKKGVLFWDIKDVLIEKETPFVLLENVDRLLKSPASRRGRDFAIMLKTFYELGYDVHWRVINAADYGMPQKRKRVFVFAYKSNLKFAKKQRNDPNLINNIFNIEFGAALKGEIKEVNIAKFEDSLEITDNFSDGKFLDCGIMINGLVNHSDIIPNVEETYTLGRTLKQAKKHNPDLTKYIVKEKSLEKWKYLKGSKRIERTSKNGHKYVYSEGTMSFPENINEPARTMLTSEGSTNRSSHIIYDEDIKEYRILTPIECELIQMFPVNWTNTMAEKKRYFMMGNALVTGIISRIEPLLRNIISSE